MYRTSKLPVILSCILVLVCLFGCAQSPAGSTDDQPLSINTTAVYTAAAANTQALQDLQLQVTCQQTVNAATETFTSTTTYSATYQGIGTESFLAQVHESIYYGSYNTEISEIYAGGKVYASVYGTLFSADMSAQDFTARYTPVVLLDTALYKTASATEHDNTITLTFSEPVGPESWLNCEDSQLLSASGTAVIENGHLTESIYHAEYTLAGITYITSVKQILSTPEDITITAPADTSAYTALTFLDAPRLLEQTIGFLLEPNSITSTITEHTVCQAAAFLTDHQTTIHTYGSGAKQMVKVDQSIQQQNHAIGGTNSTYESQELFRDNVYTISVNGAEPLRDPTITARVMQDYYMGLLLKHLPDMRYISNAVCTDLGETILLEFTCSPTMGDAICSDLNYAIFEDAAFLNSMASAYQTNTMDFYLGLDKHTGLPTSLGIKYEGQHTINGINHALTLQVDQSFELASPSSYEAITGERAPDTEPSE